MNLIRWDPFRELESIQARLNRLTTGNEEATFADWTPAVDIQESDKEYVIKADLPEVKKSDVKVHFDGGMLTIEGERTMEKEETNKRYHKLERGYGKFVRRFTMPSEVDATHVTATFKDGVLDVRVPKTEAKKAVEVKVA
jgi:HSP20 family protein